MKTTLFCFSGSGNSYWVATQLASRLGDATVVMVPSLLESEKIALTERIGFVYPVYKFFPPNLLTYYVEEVLSQQEVEHVDYLFHITTYNLASGWAEYAMESSLMKAGFGTSYSSRVRMPDTYVPLFKTAGKERIERYYRDAETKIAAIADEIEKGVIKVGRQVLAARSATRFLMKPIQRALMDEARSFVVTDACTSCEQCYRICPSANIEMVGGKPSWDRLCSGCYACYHRCPTEAIRFRHPIRGGHYPNGRSGYNVEYRQ